MIKLFDSDFIIPQLRQGFVLKRGLLYIFRIYEDKKILLHGYHMFCCHHGDLEQYTQASCLQVCSKQHQ